MPFVVLVRVLRGGVAFVDVGHLEYILLTARAEERLGGGEDERGVHYAFRCCATGPCSPSRRNFRSQIYMEYIKSTYDY